MSECSKYNLLISAYIDGELSEAEAEELKQHLDTCKDCRAYLKMLEAVSKQLGNTLIEPPMEL
jgi:anti-sigma factor RsiW